MVVWQLSSEGLSQPTTREKRLTDYAEHHCFAYRSIHSPSLKTLGTSTRAPAHTPIEQALAAWYPADAGSPPLPTYAPSSPPPPWP